MSALDHLATLLLLLLFPFEFICRDFSFLFFYCRCLQKRDIFLLFFCRTKKGKKGLQGIEQRFAKRTRKLVLCAVLFFPMKSVCANSENSVKPFLWCGKCFTECLSKPCGQFVESLPFLSSFSPPSPRRYLLSEICPQRGIQASTSSSSSPSSPCQPNASPKDSRFPRFLFSQFFGGEKGRRGGGISFWMTSFPRTFLQHFK